MPKKNTSLRFRAIFSLTFIFAAMGLSIQFRRIIFFRPISQNAVNFVPIPRGLKLDQSSKLAEIQHSPIITNLFLHPPRYCASQQFNFHLYPRHRPNRVIKKKRQKISGNNRYHYLLGACQYFFRIPVQRFPSTPDASS